MLPATLLDKQIAKLQLDEATIIELSLLCFIITLNSTKVESNITTGRWSSDYYQNRNSGIIKPVRQPYYSGQ